MEMKVWFLLVIYPMIGVLIAWAIVMIDWDFFKSFNLKEFLFHFILLMLTWPMFLGAWLIGTIAKGNSYNDEL